MTANDLKDFISEVSVFVQTVERLLPDMSVAELLDWLNHTSANDRSVQLLHKQLESSKKSVSVGTR